MNESEHEHHNPSYAGEYVNVRLPRPEYEMLKAMLAREQAVSWFWRWVKSCLFVAVGGMLSIYALVEYWKAKP